MATIKPDGSVRLGFIGAGGIMGKSMCGHLLAAGYPVTIYSRTLSKCEPLKAQGAVVVNSPAEVAAQADIVFVIVGYPSDVKEVVLGEESGVFAGFAAAAAGGKAEGKIVVDCTTSTPSLAREIYDKGQALGIATVDAPVSGGDVGAKNATLSFMIGGDKEVVERLRPLFDIMGKNVKYMGKAGSGQHTKMTNQILIASTMVGVCEGLLYAQKAGLDLEETIAAVGAGAAGSWSINNLGPRIVKRDFAPGFFVDHFLKDLGIALEESRRMNIALPGLAMAHQLYVGLKAQGGGSMGTQGLALVLERLNGVGVGQVGGGGQV